MRKSLRLECLWPQEAGNYGHSECPENKNRLTEYVRLALMMPVLLPHQQTSFGLVLHCIWGLVSVRLLLSVGTTGNRWAIDEPRREWLNTMWREKAEIPFTCNTNWPSSNPIISDTSADTSAGYFSRMALLGVINIPTLDGKIKLIPEGTTNKRRGVEEDESPLYTTKRAEYLLENIMTFSVREVSDSPQPKHRVQFLLKYKPCLSRVPISGTCRSWRASDNRKASLQTKKATDWREAPQLLVYATCRQCFSNILWYICKLFNVCTAMWRRKSLKFPKLVPKITCYLLFVICLSARFQSKPGCTFLVGTSRSSTYPKRGGTAWEHNAPKLAEVYRPPVSQPRRGAARLIDPFPAVMEHLLQLHAAPRLNNLF